MFKWLRRKRSYEYLISYNFRDKNHNNGLGRIRFNMEGNGINGFDDAKWIEDIIKNDKDFDEIIILNIIRLK